jgi:hypothetical protein
MLLESGYKKRSGSDEEYIRMNSYCKKEESGIIMKNKRGEKRIKLMIGGKVTRLESTDIAKCNCCVDVFGHHHHLF